ncbi:MAG: MGMT family protein [Candidatus Diapherotrites archaeon]
MNKVNFSQKAWEKMKEIPKGRISTYKEIAKAIGKPKAVRAVGNACNKNPFAPKVPCHRVVQSNGKIGGFAQGIKKKRELLESEGLKIRKGRIVNFEEKLFKF